MPPNAERLVSDRILANEWARRAGPPPADGWDDELAGLPPVSALAGQVFPVWVLERRLRFWDLLGHRPRPLDGRLDDVRLPDAGAEDLAAWVYGAPAVRTADPFTAGLARALGRDCDGPVADPDAGARLEQFLRSRSGPAGGEAAVLAVPPAFSRLEAATVTGDRWFGRRGPGAGWERLSGAVGWAGRMKRRLWR